MMKCLKKTKYIGIDTEFPGVVVHGDNLNYNQYSLVRENCNKLKMIQIGLSLFDKNGNLVTNDATW